MSKENPQRQEIRSQTSGLVPMRLTLSWKKQKTKTEPLEAKGAILSLGKLNWETERQRMEITQMFYITKYADFAKLLLTVLNSTFF